VCVCVCVCVCDIVRVYPCKKILQNGISGRRDTATRGHLRRQV